MVLALGGVVALSCNKTPPTPEVPRKTNAELGFSFPLPIGWTIDGQAVEAYRAFVAQLAAQDAGGRELETQQREVLSMFKKDESGRVAGRFSVFAAQTTSKEFLTGYLESLTGGTGPRPGTTLLEQKDGHEIGGQRYDLARLSVSMSPKNVLQEVYVTTRGNQAVLFSLTTNDEATLTELKAIMWGVKWER